MKKIATILLFSIVTLTLTGCGLFNRGNYEKNREGFVINDGLIVKYHTNSIGEVDIFMIDKLFTFFEAMEYTSFDPTQLDSHPTIDSFVSQEELDSCGVEHDSVIPRFIRILDNTYFYNVRDNGNCTYDEYLFQASGYTEDLFYNVEDVLPIEPTNTTRFRDADFTINTFEDILFIETIEYSAISDVWIKTIVTVLPMSYTQAGNNYEDLSDAMEEMQILETYVLMNQSINLLQLVENYEDPDVNNIWSEDTIEALGRDHEVIKNVRFKLAGDVLDIIHDTLTRLGMFQ